MGHVGALSVSGEAPRGQQKRTANSNPANERTGKTYLSGSWLPVALSCQRPTAQLLLHFPVYTIGD